MLTGASIHEAPILGIVAAATEYSDKPLAEINEELHLTKAMDVKMRSSNLVTGCACDGFVMLVFAHIGCQCRVEVAAE